MGHNHLDGVGFFYFFIFQIQHTTWGPPARLQGPHIGLPRPPWGREVILDDSIPEQVLLVLLSV